MLSKPKYIKQNFGCLFKNSKIPDSVHGHQSELQNIFWIYNIYERAFCIYFSKNLKKVEYITGSDIKLWYLRVTVPLPRGELTQEVSEWTDYNHCQSKSSWVRIRTDDPSIDGIANGVGLTTKSTMKNVKKVYNRYYMYNNLYLFYMYIIYM